MINGYSTLGTVCLSSDAGELHFSDISVFSNGDKKHYVRQTELDAVIKLSKCGDRQITMLFKDQELTLYSFKDWQKKDRQFRYPFLRLTRIPADTYIGIDNKIETLSSQVVLAGPAERNGLIGDGSPGTAIQTVRKPIPTAMKRIMIKAIGKSEIIDPALPGKNSGVTSKRKKTIPISPAPNVSTLSALILFLIMCLIFQLFRKKE